MILILTEILIRYITLAMSFIFETNSNTKPHLLISLAIGLSIAILFQWVHFHIYYKQPAGISLYWSIVDWVVWFSLALVFLQQGIKRVLWQKESYLLIGGLFIVLAGPVQILLSSSIYQISLNGDKTLLESFFHLMNKRWLQNGFIAAIFMLLSHLFMVSHKLKKAQLPLNKPITLNDGKRVHFLNPEQVCYLESARNYVSIYTNEEEIVVRASLKSLKPEYLSYGFVQISRSVLVNPLHVEKIEKYSKSSQRMILDDGTTINVGKTYQPDVTEAFH